MKPFARDELVARVRVGERIVELQESLRARVRELYPEYSRIREEDAAKEES